MIAWLQKIWCVLTQIPCYVESAIIGFVNLLMLGIGIAVSAALSLLPDMPSLPTTPEAFETAAGWVAWFFPVSTVVDIFAFLVAAWVIWQIVVIALRWAKASAA